MKKLTILVGAVLLCAASFVAGRFLHLRSAVPQANPAQRSAVRSVKPSPRDGEHLVPVPLWRADSMEIARAVFKEAYGADVRARVYQWLPGDNMLFITEHEGRYSIVGLTSQTQLIQYQKDFPFAKRHPAEPTDYHDIKPERCEAQLSNDLGRRVVSMWRKALLETRYDEHPVMGSIDFQASFSMEDQEPPAQGLSGMTWFPLGHVGTLLAVNSDLWAICQKGSSAPTAALAKDLEELEHDLK